MSESRPRKRGNPNKPASDKKAVSDGRDAGKLADGLLRTIEADIIPRLLLSHRATSQTPHPAPPHGGDIKPADIKRLSGLCLMNDSGAAWACTREIIQRGVPLEAVFLNLLAPVARHLGKLWEDDKLDFSSVAVALLRLQQILRELAPAFSAARARVAPRLPPRILMAGLPGEQHRLGLMMVGEFLRADGWDVCLPANDTLQAILGVVRKTHCDVVGFSLGSTVGLDRLQALINKVRAASQNQALKVMVGGPIFADDAGRAAPLGADACARDAREAVSMARELLRHADTAGLAATSAPILFSNRLKPH